MHAARCARTVFTVCVLVASGSGASDWVVVAPKLQGFSASFPREPTFVTSTESTPRGEWTSSSWTVEDQEAQSAFMVTVKDYSRYDTSGPPISKVLEAQCLSLEATARITRPGGADAALIHCSLDGGVGGTELVAVWSAPVMFVVSQICGRAPCNLAARRRFFESFRYGMNPRAMKPLPVLGRPARR